MSDLQISKREFLGLFIGLTVMGAAAQSGTRHLGTATDVMFGHNLGGNILTVKNLVTDFVNADSFKLAKHYRSFFPAVAWRCDIDAEGFERIPTLIELDALGKRTKKHLGASRFGSEVLAFSQDEAQKLKMNIHRAKAIGPIAACHRQFLDELPSRRQTFDLIRAGIEHVDPVVGEITCQNLVTSLIMGSETRKRASFGELFAQSTEHLYALTKHLVDMSADPSQSQVFMHALVYLQNARAVCADVEHFESASQIETAIQSLRRLSAPHLSIAFKAAEAFKYTTNLTSGGLCPQTFEALMSWENHANGVQHEYALWAGLKHLQVLYFAYCECDESQLSLAPEKRDVEELKVWKLIGAFRNTGFFEGMIKPRLSSTGDQSLYSQLAFDPGFRDFVFDDLARIIGDSNAYTAEQLSDEAITEGRMMSLRWPHGPEFLSPHDRRCISETQKTLNSAMSGSSSWEAVKNSISDAILSGAAGVGGYAAARPALQKMLARNPSTIDIPADVHQQTIEIMKAFAENHEQTNAVVNYSGNKPV